MTNLAMAKEINFYEDTLMGVQDESGNIYLAVKNTAINIGLTDDQARNEVKKIQELDLFKSSWVKFNTPQKQGERMVLTESLFILEKFVPMWLAQINITPKMKVTNPETCEKLLKYQLECVDILHNAFMSNENSKKDFYDRFDINIENILNAKLDQYIKPLNYKIKELNSTVVDMSKYIEKLNQKHEIFENESSLFSNLLTNFHAKIYNQGTSHIGAYNDLYDAITSFTGIYIPKSAPEAKRLNYKSIKDYVLKKFGIDFIKMFNNGILDGRIVKVDSGEFIDLSGIFHNSYEWDKILKAFTDKEGNIHCAYCKKIITSDEAYKEHAIHQSHIESSDCIWNIVPACGSCNGSKDGNRYDEWYPKQDFFDENYYKRIIRHMNKYKPS